MKVLIVGGSSSHRGGLEIFCERAVAALSLNRGLDVRSMPTGSAFLTPRRLPSLLLGLLRLARELVIRRPDVVWIQYAALPDLFYLVLAKVFFVQVAVTPHLGVAWRSRRHPLLRKVSNLLLRCADSVAVLSPTQIEEIEVGRDARVFNISTLLPLSSISGAAGSETCAASPDRLRLVHSARLSAEKGTLLFVDLCRTLAAAGLDFEANISGAADDAFLVELGRAIDAASLSDRIRLLGRLDEEAQRNLLQRSDVLIHLSFSDSYPLIVLEAIAQAVLPVCLDLPGARHMVAKYDGQVVSQHDPVAETARFLIGEDVASLRRRASAAASRIRAEMSWESCQQLIADALAKTANVQIGPGRERQAPT